MSRTLELSLFEGATAPVDRPPDATGLLAGLVARIQAAEQDGFSTVWLAHIVGLDALTALAVAGSCTSRISLGTAVVPVQPRHVLALAQQALTTHAATTSRLRLGIGMSHRVVVERSWGMEFDHPLGRMTEYLDALLPLLRGDSVSQSGRWVTAHAKLELASPQPPPVYLAALGPRLLRLAGERTNGTVTWMAGPRTIAEHIRPAIDAGSAPDAPAPRVVAALPVMVTDDPDRARQLAAESYSIYGRLPSYQAMLERERVLSPADVSIIGDEAHVAMELVRLFDAGADEFAGSLFGSAEDRARTRALLASLIDRRATE